MPEGSTVVTELDQTRLTLAGRIAYSVLFFLQFAEAIVAVVVGMFSGAEAASVTFGLWFGGIALAASSFVGFVSAIFGVFARPVFIVTTSLAAVCLVSLLAAL